MSTPSATARYVITADDKTKSAIASIRNGFKSMESNVKATVSRINLAFGLIAGGSLKRTLQSVFTETARGSKEFATALDDVRHSARRLLAAKEGAPAAAAAMRELAAVLKDPEFQAAADKITTALIKGFTGTVKFATGVKSLREEIDSLKQQRDELARSASQGGNQPRRYIKGEPQFIENDPQTQIYGLSLQIEQKEKQLREQETAAARRQEAMWARIDAAGDKATRRFETMRELQENIKWIEDTMKDAERISPHQRDTRRRSEFLSPEDRAAFEHMTREADVAAIRVRESFFEGIDRDAGNVSETLQRTGDSIDEVGERIGENIGALSQWSVYADQAARNIQDSFADFLFDPFRDGLDGMLRGFIDVIRRMAAEAAAARIFGSKTSGGLGIGDIIGGWLGSLGGGAVGGTGAGGGVAPGGGALFADVGIRRVPRDNQVAILHKNEAVIPADMNPFVGRSAGGGSITLSPVYNIDARGATMELQRALPEILKRNNQQLETTIVQKLRRRQYNLR